MPRAPDGAAASEVAYAAVPVRLAPGSQELRYLYVRPHRAEAGANAEAMEAAQRTLFIACVPVRCVACRQP